MGFRQTLRYLGTAGWRAALLILFCVPGAAENAQPQTSPIVVQAFDRAGHLLHSGLGFLYDQSTLVCSYDNIRNASIVKFRTDDEGGYANRLISYNPSLDVAVLKTEQEMTAQPLGSSDMVAAGDSVYFFRNENRGWIIDRTTIKGFIDSGNGYEMMRLQSATASSPLLNADGKVIGWLNQSSSAVPLQAIAQLLTDRESSVPLSEINDASRVCDITASESAGSKKLEATEMETAEGTKSFPFQIDFPRAWKSFKSVSTARYLLRVMQPAAGVCVELRVMPQKIDDLPIAIQQSETILNSGMTRAELEPFSGENFSGFRANYLDANPSSDQALTAFYSMAHRNFYVLAVRYPKKYREEIQPLIDQIVASLHL